MIDVTDRMVARAVASVPTVMALVYGTGEVETAFQAKRIFARLPSQEWQWIKTTLQTWFGEALDARVLEAKVKAVRQTLRKV